MEEGFEDQRLSEFRKFLQGFLAEKDSPLDDPIQTRGSIVGSFRVPASDVPAEIIDWVLLYLHQRKCPQELASLLAKEVQYRVETLLPNIAPPVTNGGTNDADSPSEGQYMLDSFMLHEEMLNQLQNVCNHLLSPDSSAESALRSAVGRQPQHQTAVVAVKNSRRKMEDRHVVIHDLNALCGLVDGPTQSYYAVFDGHSGVDAASFCSAHLHWNMVQHPKFECDPKMALREAFAVTEEQFQERSERENIKSGCTALCCLIREKIVYLAWLGDSQGVLVKKGMPVTVMVPHKPERADERERVEQLGGCVMHVGIWRVNGVLAVSRALGDFEHKPCISSDPDIIQIELDGEEDFLVLGCDGLWDTLTPNDVTAAVYHYVNQQNHDIDDIAAQLAQQAIERGSTDNITVIIVFLRDLQTLAAQSAVTSFSTESSVNHKNIPFDIEGNCHSEQMHMDGMVFENGDGDYNLGMRIGDPISTNGPEEIYHPRGGLMPETTLISELPTPPIEDLIAGGGFHTQVDHGSSNPFVVEEQGEAHDNHAKEIASAILSSALESAVQEAETEHTMHSESMYYEQEITSSSTVESSFYSGMEGVNAPLETVAEADNLVSAPKPWVLQVEHSAQPDEVDYLPYGDHQVDENPISPMFSSESFAGKQESTIPLEVQTEAMPDSQSSIIPDELNKADALNFEQDAQKMEMFFSQDPVAHGDVNYNELSQDHVAHGDVNYNELSQDHVAHGDVNYNELSQDHVAHGDFNYNELSQDTVVTHIFESLQEATPVHFGEEFGNPEGGVLVSDGDDLQAWAKGDAPIGAEIEAVQNKVLMADVDLHEVHEDNIVKPEIELLTGIQDVLLHPEEQCVPEFENQVSVTHEFEIHTEQFSQEQKLEENIYDYREQSEAQINSYNPFSDFEAPANPDVPSDHNQQPCLDPFGSLGGFQDNFQQVYNPFNQTDNEQNLFGYAEETPSAIRSLQGVPEMIGISEDVPQIQTSEPLVAPEPFMTSQKEVLAAFEDILVPSSPDQAPASSVEDLLQPPNNNIFESVNEIQPEGVQEDYQMLLQHSVNQVEAAPTQFSEPEPCLEVLPAELEPDSHPEPILEQIDAKVETVTVEEQVEEKIVATETIELESVDQNKIVEEVKEAQTTETIPVQNSLLVDFLAPQMTVQGLVDTEAAASLLAPDVPPTPEVILDKIPDGVPEADGVTEDSDSEKDGGWSYVSGKGKDPSAANSTAEKKPKLSNGTATTKKPSVANKEPAKATVASKTSTMKPLDSKAKAKPATAKISATATTTTSTATMKKASLDTVKKTTTTSVTKSKPLSAPTPRPNSSATLRPSGSPIKASPTSKPLAAASKDSETKIAPTKASTLLRTAPAKKTTPTLRTSGASGTTTTTTSTLKTASSSTSKTTVTSTSTMRPAKPVPATTAARPASSTMNRVAQKPTSTLRAASATLTSKKSPAPSTAVASRPSTTVAAAAGRAPLSRPPNSASTLTSKTTRTSTEAKLTKDTVNKQLSRQPGTLKSKTPTTPPTATTNRTTTSKPSTLISKTKNLKPASTTGKTAIKAPVKDNLEAPKTPKEEPSKTEPEKGSLEDKGKDNHTVDSGLASPESPVSPQLSLMNGNHSGETPNEEKVAVLEQAELN